MAITDSLTSWREHLAHQPVDVPRMTSKDLRQLNEADKDAYDAQRLQLLEADATIRTPQLAKARHTVQAATLRLTPWTSTARRGIAISGNSTLGKSTMLMDIGRDFEKQRRTSNGLLDDPSFIPVLYTVVPAAATPVKLMTAFSSWLGLPTAGSRPRLDQLTDQVVGVLRAAGTRLVLIDEAQNLTSNRQHGQDAASAMKSFAERLDATFVYAGIDLLRSSLFAGQIGQQMRGRMTVHQVTPFTIKGKDGAQEWVNLIAEMEHRILRLARQQPGALASKCWRDLFDLTGGSIGTLKGLLVEAATEAIRNESEQITLAQLRSIPVDVQATDLRKLSA